MVHSLVYNTPLHATTSTTTNPLTYVPIKHDHSRMLPSYAPAGTGPLMPVGGTHVDPIAIAKIYNVCKIITKYSKITVKFNKLFYT